MQAGGRTRPIDDHRHRGGPAAVVAAGRYHRRVTITDAPAEAASRAALAPAAELFRGLGDPARLALLQRLAQGEARVVDLVAELGLAQSTVSAHLACLRDCGLVDSRPEGRASVYSLTRPELLDLFTTAETLLAATGNAVTLRAGFGGLRSELRPTTTHDEESTR
jgi:DNA-binding transcriptional ArsR family regulator